jgi:hypothetical protein
MRSHVDGNDFVRQQPGFGAYQRGVKGVEITDAYGFCGSIDRYDLSTVSRR